MLNNFKVKPLSEIEQYLTDNGYAPMDKTMAPDFVKFYVKEHLVAYYPVGNSFFVYMGGKLIGTDATKNMLETPIWQEIYKICYISEDSATKEVENVTEVAKSVDPDEKSFGFYRWLNCVLALVEKELQRTLNSDERETVGRVFAANYNYNDSDFSGYVGRTIAAFVKKFEFLQEINSPKIDPLADKIDGFVRDPNFVEDPRITAKVAELRQDYFDKYGRWPEEDHVEFVVNI